MNKPVILTFIRHYLPGFKSGGPVRTLENMVKHLNSELSFYIVTSDRDALDTEPYPDININEWNEVGPALVYYAAQNNRSFNKFVNLIRETPHDALYLNSFFDPVFTQRPLIARVLCLIPRRPIVLAPRGELSEGALGLKKGKKQLYLFFSKAFWLYRNIIWQASSEHEAIDIKRIMRRIARCIEVAPDLYPPANNFAEHHETTVTTENEITELLYLSRIAPMKNLDYALRVLTQVKVKVVFNIYGPIWDKVYWQRCLELIQGMPNNIKVNYWGPVSSDSVKDVMKAHSIFFFPTRGENFGHVILEALAAGTPVLISDKTPWVDDGNGGCMVRSLNDINGFVDAIEKFAMSSQDEVEKRRKAAKAIAIKYTEDENLRNQNLTLFKNAIQNY